ncbi:hypothetical protein [Brevibacterium aurantiacum]|uniref:hypothetical protein n=1 Tax=Brevibacterium aurantiacum TaxID=273384 RepID=UPI000FCBFB45|nr:hypothetical protein [Brevibacterium aurantiacum]
MWVFDPGTSSPGFDLLGSLFNSWWAWQLVGLGAFAAVLMILVIYGLFVLGRDRGQTFERRVMQEVQEREAGHQPGKHACPSPVVHHAEQLQDARGDVP